jgi:dTDP-glucose 4,6-dehydratase
MKVAKVTADIRRQQPLPVCDGMPSVYVRCFSSPLPEWRRARHVLDHCRAIPAVLTADVTPILPEAAARPELLPIYDVSARHGGDQPRDRRAHPPAPGQGPRGVDRARRRPAEPRRYLIEPAKLERELGWLPTVDFAAGLAETVDWYVANEAWWQDILRSKGEPQIAWSAVQ